MEFGLVRLHMGLTWLANPEQAVRNVRDNLHSCARTVDDGAEQFMSLVSAMVLLLEHEARKAYSTYPVQFFAQIAKKLTPTKKCTTRRLRAKTDRLIFVFAVEVICHHATDFRLTRGMDRLVRRVR